MSLKSIFDLPRSKNELSSVNQGMSNAYYDEVASLRSIIDTDQTNRFGSGLITYRWNYGSSWWVPSRSYFVFDVELSKADGSILTEDDNIAINMNPCACLFSKLQFLINDKTISEISEHVPQVQAIKTRLCKTGEWLNTTGNNLSFWESSFKKRQHQVIENGAIIDDIVGVIIDEPVVADKDELGLDGASTLGIDVAHVATFVSGANPINCFELFKPGDLLLINFGAEAGHNRALWVVDITTPLTIQLASFGTTIANAGVVSNNYTLSRYRYSDVVERIIYTQGDFTNIANTAINQMDADGGDYRYAIQGDIICNAQNGGLIYEGQPYVRKQATDQLIGASFKVSTVIGANGGNNMVALRFPGVEITELGDLGYIQNDQFNGHSVDIAVNGGADALLTITAIGNAVPVPDVNQNFKVGDLVVAQLQANAELFCGFVSQVDPTGNGASLSVVGEDVLNGARGANNNGQNYMLQRIRLSANNTLQSSTDINTSRQVKTFQLIWQPPLSIFSIPYAIPACGKFELHLTPFSNTIYQKNFIESILDDKTHLQDFRLLIKNVLLKNLKTDGPIVEQDEFFFDLNEIRAQSNTITTGQRSQYSLDISPSTYGLSVSFQDEAADSSTLYSQSRFKVRNNAELSIQNFYLRYGGLQKPIPDYRPIFSFDSNEDSIVELYARNLFYDGSYYDSSKEKLYEWRERGIYMHFPWPKEGSLKETRVYVSTQFSDPNIGAPGGYNPRIFLFNHFKKVVIVQIENGTVQNVIMNES